MALTATATQGFEFIGTTTGDEIYYWPGNPGATFTKGDLVSFSNGVLIRSTDSLTNMIGVVTRSTVCPANTQAFPLVNDPISWDAEDKTLVPVKPLVPGGVPKFKVTFAGQADDTVAAYTAPDVTLTTSTGANDDCNSALMYVYEGPGAGEVNIVENYVHSTLVLTAHRQFATTLTTSSKVIILEGEGSAGDGISLMGRLDIADHNNLDVTEGQDNGEFIIFMDWKELAPNLKNLSLIVIPRLGIGQVT